MKQSSNRKQARSTIVINVLISLMSVIVTVALIMGMLLNAPIISYQAYGKEPAQISVTKYYKSRQPVIYKEGTISRMDASEVEYKEEVDREFNDQLDLNQTIEGQFTILFLGFDSEENGSGKLHDVNYLMQFNLHTASLNILQIPRDTFTPDYTSNTTHKFNSIYNWGDPSETPIQRVVTAVQENYGVPVDAYLTTTCDNVAKIVDLIGGIPIHLDNEIIYEADKRIPAGDVVLDGSQAEWFVRFRHEWLQGDIGRVQNQRRFMRAAMEKLLDIVKNEGKMKLYSYLNTIYKNKWIATNMSVEDLSKLADFGSTLQMENVKVDMVPGEDAEYIAYNGQVYSIYSIHKRATIDKLNENFRPYQRPMLLSDSNIIEYVSEYEYEYELYDDTGMTFEELETATEPMRNPEMRPAWKEYEE